MSAATFRSLPLSVAQLSLPAVLKCGQSFRWQCIPLLPGPSATSKDHNAPELIDSPAHEWRLALLDRVVCLRQTPDTLLYRAVFPAEDASVDEALRRDESTLAWLRDYFQLDVDLEKLYEEWSANDPVFRKVQERFGGIRMLRQDPWENLVSFICSQNNHISRITGMVQKLCAHFSPSLLTTPVGDLMPEAVYHAFPPPHVLADPSVEGQLRDLGFGYRAKYIQKTAALLCERHTEPLDWLLGLRKLSVGEARTALLELHGVGPKVADCILLMSMDKASVVPVDTHVYQIAVKHYGLRGSPGKAAMTPQLYAQVTERFTSIWGAYAGWAHSVLFTSDLKSFSDYGLGAPPSVSPSPARSTASTAVDPDSLSRASTPTKRKRIASVVEIDTLLTPTRLRKRPKAI